MLKLRVANGRPHRCVLGPDSHEFGAWLTSGGPAFLGTFHVGNSDLTGFLLASQDRRRVHIVRLRVGNSEDTDALARRLGGLVRYVWVNEPGDMLFALKEAGSSGDAVALQCDRPDHSSRTETFDFLGARRIFPFTIYHLALIFSRPVFLSIGAPAGPDVVRRARVAAVRSRGGRGEGRWRSGGHGRISRRSFGASSPTCAPIPTTG